VPVVHNGHRFGSCIVVCAALLLASAPAWAEEAGGHAAAAGGEAHAGPQLNWTDFANRHTAPVVALVVNFVVLMWLLVHFGRAPLTTYLADRRRKVEEEIDQAYEEKVRAEGKLRGVLLRTKNLEEELAHLREDLTKVGQDERDRTVVEAGVRADRIRREAEAQAVEAERQAGRELRGRMVEQALEGARRALRDGLAPADQARLADEFVRRLPSPGVQVR
jgi:F-type H+-transporting ATPase subunit b